MSRLPLASLEIASIVARHESFSEAATELGLTHGAISRKIASLETWLGTLLFERHGRGIRLTPDGQRFIAQINEAFRQIDQASDRWKRSSSTTIRISVLPSFAKLWFMGQMKLLETKVSGFRIDLAIEHRNADLESGEVDIAIRYGRGRWPNVKSLQFGTERHYPIASRDLARSLGKRPTFAQLHELSLLHDSDATGWRNWFKEIAGVSIKPKASDRRFEDYTLTLAAAEQGLGIALARAPMVNQYLRGNTLVRIHECETDSPLNYFSLTRAREDRPHILHIVGAIHKQFAAVAKA
jgi:LysR family glycine cleavage system transcriptional activator